MLRYSVGLLLILWLTPLAASEEIVIVTNKFNQIPQLTPQEAKRLFLGKNKHFKNGLRARIIDQPDKNPIKSAFYTSVTGKDLYEVVGRWASLIFSGDIIPPETGKNDTAVKEWIAENISGVGYIYRKNADSQVKIIFYVPELE